MKVGSRVVAVIAGLGVVAVVALMSTGFSIPGVQIQVPTSFGTTVSPAAAAAAPPPPQVKNCVEHRDGLAVYGLWVGHPPHAQYHERRNTTLRAFPRAASCVREGLRGKNLLFVGDETVRAQYMSLVTLVHFGEYKDLDVLSPNRSVYSDGKKDSWVSSQEFITTTNALFGGAECCECSRQHQEKGGAKPPREVENRWYHSREFGFNITFMHMKDSARGGDMAGWSPTCPNPAPVVDKDHGVKITWPDQKPTDPKTKPSTPELAKVVTKAWGPKAVDVLVWGYTKDANNKPYEHASLDKLQKTIGKVEDLMRPETGIKLWASCVAHPSSNRMKLTKGMGRAEWVDTGEVGLVDWIASRGWKLLPRLTMMSEIVDELMPLDHPERMSNKHLMFMDNKDLPQPYMYGAFNDVVLNEFIPEGCTVCPKPTPSPSPKPWSQRRKKIVSRPT